MSDSFREPVVEAPVATETPQEAPQAVALPEGDKLQGNESPATDELTADEKNIEVWEGLHRTKFIESHFKIKEFAGEFPLKMQVSHIDKYIKSQIAEKQYENNIENYEKVLQEIEEEAGSERLETFTRLKRISEYIKVLNKFNALKEKKASFKTLLDG